MSWSPSNARLNESACQAASKYTCGKMNGWSVKPFMLGTLAHWIGGDPSGVPKADTKLLNMFPACLPETPALTNVAITLTPCCWFDSASVGISVDDNCPQHHIVRIFAVSGAPTPRQSISATLDAPPTKTKQRELATHVPLSH